ncbi:hypothetical protein [Deinococcus sp. Marseille-Q6407]|uniref:WapI family immunity protein n=1 Tax=Deinococcus sp. Marseille-Q6407 TaxID=2969223 RepID=UPI0021BEF24A|nr:hypothetical protein [Deinococcus sp. Marseille-Q6407]
MSLAFEGVQEGYFSASTTYRGGWARAQLDVAFPKVAVEAFQSQIEQLCQSLWGEAFLGTEYEDDFGLLLVGNGRGQIRVRLHLENGNAAFSDSFETDQTYLLPFIKVLRQLTVQYPATHADAAYLKPIPAALKEQP